MAMLWWYYTPLHRPHDKNVANAFDSWHEVVDTWPAWPGQHVLVYLNLLTEHHPLIWVWSSYPSVVPFIRLQNVRECGQLVNCLNWGWSSCRWYYVINCLNIIIWSYPILFIRLQGVRQLDQLFRYISSDRLIPSSPESTFELGRLFEYPILTRAHPLPLSPASTWTVNCLSTPHLIILFICL